MGESSRAPGQVSGSSDREMVPFVVERRPEFTGRKRVLRVTRIIAERSAIFVVAHRTRQRVVHGEVRLVETTSPVADVHAIVTRTSDRLFVTQGCPVSARPQRQTRRRVAGRSHTSSAGPFRCVVSGFGDELVRINRNLRIQVDGLVLMQAEHVNVFNLERGLGVERPGIATVELFGHWRAIVGVHRDGRLNPALVVRKLPELSAMDLRYATDPAVSPVPGTMSLPLRAKAVWKMVAVGLLFHEQRNVLEGVVIVHAEAAAEHVVAMTGQIIGKADARAEALAVIGGLLGHQRCRQRTDWGDRLEFLERAAVGNLGSTNEVKVLVPAQAKVQRQAVG